ncbi:hypothetical protein ALSL_2472 [Aerosticca soli]|uniref:Uncharacterized protein n=1 Tax=Aerosticca soli TaxID=2010829 RepID=A0A2Z6E7I1_9GAMM|nr:hypothetical protein ALSL_2472 [Aerosticca soli]
MRSRMPSMAILGCEQCSTLRLLIIKAFNGDTRNSLFC